MITKPVFRIPHIRWRDGRPRFDPGPQLRVLGYKSRDLRHPDGTWFTAEQAVAESHRISVEALARKAHKASGQKLSRLSRPSAGRTLGDLCEAVFELPEFNATPVVEGRKVRKPLAAKTVKGYKGCLSAVRKGCVRAQSLALERRGIVADSLWDAPVSALTAPMAETLLEAIEIDGGLHVARFARAFLSQMWGRLAVKEPGVNRHLWGEVARMPVPEGRVAPWTLAQFIHMLATADAMGRPEMADMFVLGAVHGQRQRDRLLLEYGGAETATHYTVRQSKRGKLVTLLKTPLLVQRLTAALQRRAAHKVAWPHMVIDEKARKPWNPEGDHYRHVFAEIRATAATTMPDCATLRDQDLRDTNQTWLDQALVDDDVMAAIAGHSPASAAALRKKHYVAHNQTRMDAAVQVIDALMQKKDEGK